MVTKRTALTTLGTVGGLILLAVGATAAPPPPTPTTTKNPKHLGFTELSNGRGGTNVEAFVLPDGFDNARSLAAFKETLYPLLRANCSGCHSTENPEIY